MQTFITDRPSASYGLFHLDQKRIVKQLLETRQIMGALAGASKGWVNHPATRMWYGKEDMLYDYALENARELDSRGYKWENNFEYLNGFYNLIVETRDADDLFTDDDYRRIVYTHRGRLYEKDPSYYAQWIDYSDYKKHVCCDHCNYFWPTHLYSIKEENYV